MGIEKAARRLAKHEERIARRAIQKESKRIEKKVIDGTYKSAIGKSTKELIERNPDAAINKLVGSQNAIPSNEIISAARTSRQSELDNVFSGNDFTFDRNKVIRNNPKTGYAELDNEGILKERKRMNKQYNEAYDNGKSKGTLPNDISKDEYIQLQNKNEVSSRISSKKSNNEMYMNEKKLDSEQKQFSAVSKYGGKGKSKTIKEMKSRSYESRTPNVSKNTTSAAAAAAAEKDNKFFNQKNIRRGVGVGVTGALVLSMFNNGGQQSNAELYGQQQQRY